MTDPDLTWDELSRHSIMSVRELEERSKAIFDQSPIAIELYDPSGELIIVNESCLNLFGIDNISEIKGFSLFADPNISDENKEKLLHGEMVRYQGPFDFGMVRQLQLYHTSRSGIIWLDVLIKPMGIDGGGNGGYLIHIQEITEARQVEAAFRESERQYRNLYDEAPVGLYRSKPDGTILLANRAIVKMLGFSSFQELQTRNLSQSGFSATYNRKNFLEEIEKNGEVKDLEATWTSVNGEIRYVRENANAVRDESGNTLYYEGSVEDITETRMIQKALRESEKKYERIVSNIKDAVYSVDGETGEYTYLSPAFENLLGYSEEDVRRMGGRKAFLARVMPSGTSVLHDDRLKQLQARLINEGMTDEIWWNCKDGTLKCIADHWVPIYERGKLVSTDGVLRDITYGKRTEEALSEALLRAEASDRLKTAFMNNISHEVRTPLNGILGFVEMMEQPGLTDEDKALYKEILSLSSERLLNTINSYMDISLLVSGNIVVNPTEFDLIDVIKTGYNTYLDQTALKGVTINMNLEEFPDGIMMKTDLELVRKVYLHLLGNAVKFTEYGSVNISLKNTGASIEIAISDTGIGISEDLREKIFDTFLQADPSNTRRHEGSGLGLAIAKGLVDILGGRIWVESTLGKGSTFGFTLPFVLPDIKEKTDDLDRIPEPDSEPPVVLIAEDDQINIFLLETILSKTRAVTWHVENGKLAVDFCRSHPEVSLVLMDLKMPVMDGLQATREIKTFRKNLPIVAVTAFAMPGDRESALNAGCDEYLTKPFTTALLKEKLKEFITL